MGMLEKCMGSVYAAGISWSLISHWQMKHVQTDWQFQIFVHQFHTPMQLNIVKNPC